VDDIDQAAAGYEMFMGFFGQAPERPLPGMERRIAEHKVEGAVVHRREPVAHQGLRVADAVERDIAPGELDREGIAVHERRTARWRAARRDDADDAVPAAHIRDAICRVHIGRLQEQAGPIVHGAPREDAAGAEEREGLATQPDIESYLRLRAFVSTIARRHGAARDAARDARPARFVEDAEIAEKLLGALHRRGRSLPHAGHEQETPARP
jgi:hypothetical protein